ncbi:MAG: hypothetical protein S4CHLAM37_16000 [Chlamydiia bacterium]|nr:hypothetical protein [Chlamydiia bacterium]
MIAFSTQTLVYNKVTGSKHVTTTWTVDEKNDEYTIQGISKNQIVDIKALVPYKLIRFEHQSKKNSDFYSIRLVNRKLVAEGEKKGQRHKSTNSIGNTPWVQDFEFGLKPFILSNKKTFTFYIVNPSNLKIHKMVARKLQEEKITVDGVNKKTLYVKLTLAGMKKLFWKAQLWFDAEKGDMIMYKANEGPHTPTTTITLASIDGKPEGWLKSMFKSDDDDDDHEHNSDEEHKENPKKSS